MTSAGRAPVVGMVGGGQLARMSAAPAAALGVELRVLALAADDSAAQVVTGVDVGRHDDPDAVRAFASRCDVLTFDHEHVPPDVLRGVEADGTAVRPGPGALVHAQDKLVMRRRLAAAGLPVPPWAEVTSVDDLGLVGERIGFPLVLKVSRGGYDGRGVWVVDDREAAAAVVATTPVASDVGWLAEAYVPFTAELAAQVARSPQGQAVAYPVVRTVQRDGMCRDVVAPAPGVDPERAVQAQALALRVADVLGVTGMLAVELFDTGSGLLVNELAMRPHNSGHWTIEGAVTSQFENHLRAVLDLPLGDPRARDPYAVMVNLVGAPSTGTLGDVITAYRHVMARDPGVHVHLYGKQPRPGRKLGHVTVGGTALDDLIERGHHAADYLMGVIDE